MRRGRFWAAVAAVAVCVSAAWLLPSMGAERPASLRYTGVLVAGGYAWEFEEAWNVVRVAAPGPFTGFAFGPGRAELAYCAPTSEGTSGLWIVSPPLSERGLQMPESGELPRRLLWSAPEGVTLRGPIWWAPNGSALALRTCKGEGSDLIVVDYVTGDATCVAAGGRVLDSAWSPGADQLAYVLGEDSVVDGYRATSVWLTDMQSSVGRRLGDGGMDLRWSVDGRELVWLKPQPGNFWTEMVWPADGGQTRQGEQRPARPEGAMWSPDGLWCAAATGQGDSKQLVICRSGSPKGEAVKLPGAPVKQLLGWSPDSSMLLVLSADNRPLAVRIEQLPDDVAKLLATEGAMFSPERAAIAGWPVNTSAGPPSWSSTGTLMLAYVASRYPNPAYVAGRYPDPVQVARYGLMDADFGGSLVVGVVRRDYIGPPDRLAYNIERKQLLSNMKHVATALQMYFTDWDVYPLAQGTEQLMDARFGVDEYIGSDTYYMRPGVKGEVAVKYLVPPGASASWFRENGVEAKYAAIAIIDYHPDYFVVAYADGHVEQLDRREWEFDGTALRRR